MDINRYNQQTPMQFKCFFLALILFSATWLTADIAAVKFVSVFGIILTGGFFIFPFTTMLSTIIVEVYGYKNARQAIWSGFILNLTFVIFINLVNIIPASPYWKLQDEFNKILVPGTRIIIASLISFLLADFASSYIMAKMKVTNQGKSLIKRILLASIFSISIDIVSFIFLAFVGTMPANLLLTLMVTAFLKKIFCQVALIPIVWYLIDLLKKYEGVEVYDFDTKFNPFSFDNVYQLKSFRDIKHDRTINKTIINMSER